MNFKWVVCRICLKSAEKNMVSIFSEASYENSANDKLIMQQIMLCGGIQINEDDNLPDSICEKCAGNLSVAFEFRLQCQQSAKQLTKFFGKRVKEEVIVNYDEPEFVEEQQNDEVAEEAINAIEEVEEENSVSAIDEETEGQDVVEVQEMHMKCDEEEEVVVDTTTHSGILYIEKQGEDEYLEVEEETAEDSDQLYVNEIDAEEELADYTVDYLIEDFEVEEYGTTVKEEVVDTQPEDEEYVPPPQPLRRRSKVKSDPLTSVICHICGNLYPNKMKLSQHARIHNDKPFQCEICNKKFSQSVQLSRHMNSHTGVRPYQCKHCPSKFADPSTCIKHERIHTKSRPYECPTCGKSFSYSNVLKVHIMTHTGEKPYECDVCGKKFTQQHHMRTHKKTHAESSTSKQKVKS